MTIALFTAAAVGCTSRPATTPRTNHSPQPLSVEGQLLVEAPSDVGEFALADPKTASLTPLRTGLGDPWFPSGIRVAGGRVYALFSRFAETGIFGGEVRGGRLFEVSVDRRPQSIGPRLPRNRSGVLIGVSGSIAVVGSCGNRKDPGGILALDLDDPVEWKDVTDGCDGAISPDGRSLVALRSDKGGDSLWRVPLADPEAATRLSSPADLEPLVRSGVRRPRLESLVWGDAGIAAAVVEPGEQSERRGVFVVKNDGTTASIPLGTAEVFDLAWQPGGSHLAVVECLNCRRFFRANPAGELIVYDAASDEVREVAMTRGQFFGLAWSPDGTALVTQWQDRQWLFLGPDGEVLGRKAITAAPIEWMAE